MLSHKQSSTALFILCMGTFLALLGCSLVISFVVGVVIGLSLLGISYLKKSLMSATTVIDSDSGCSVTVKRNEQKPEPSFLGKAHVTPTKLISTGVTPNIKDVKQALHFKSVSNSPMTTPIKNLNKSVIKLQNSHLGNNPWPLNSTPIERKSVLMEQNYQLPIMKAINNNIITQQQHYPYSVKRSAGGKECSPPIVSQHKKPKTLPLLKEGHSLRVPTVYVVHKKADNILKNKGNKRFLENTESVNDSKRRNKEDGEIEKPQKRKLLSIVHITGKKHKVPSINSPTKYSRNTDLVVTKDDLEEDRRRNDERVRKLLAHKDDDNIVPSIKPAVVPESSTNLADQIPNKPDASKSIVPSNKENAPPSSRTSPLPPESSQASAETPKSKLDGTDKAQSPSIGAESKVVKSLFGGTVDSNNAGISSTTTFSFGSLKPEQNPIPTLPTNASPSTSNATNQQDVKPGLGSIDVKPATTLTSFKFGQTTIPAVSTQENIPKLGFGTTAVKTAPTLGVTDTKSTFSFESQAAQSSIKPQISFGSVPTNTLSPAAPAISVSVTSSTSNPVPSFSFGKPASQTSVSTTDPTVSFGASTSTATTLLASSTDKPTFSFGGGASTDGSKMVGFSGLPTSNIASFVSTPANNSSALGTSNLSSGFSFGSVPASTPAFGASNTTPAFGASNTTPAFGASNTTPAFGASNTTPAFGASNATPAFGASNATPAFGASNTTPAFGVSNATPAFGASNATSAFGASNTTPAFGASNATPAFGASNATPAFGASNTTPAFGASNATPAFGASNTTPAFGASSTTPAFGANNATPAFGATSATPAFGASSATSAFGAATGTTAPFGTSATSTFGSSSTIPQSFGPQSTNNVFGTNNPTSSTSSAPAGTFSFGSSNTAAKPGGFTFGSSTPSVPTFGSATSSAPTTSPATFGASSATTSGFSFGASSGAAAASGGFSFGGNTPSAPSGNFNFGGGTATNSGTFGNSSPAAPANLFSSPNTPSAGRRIATPRRRKAR